MESSKEKKIVTAGEAVKAYGTLKEYCFQQKENKTCLNKCVFRDDLMQKCVISHITEPYYDFNYLLRMYDKANELQRIARANKREQEERNGRQNNI